MAGTTSPLRSHSTETYWPKNRCQLTRSGPTHLAPPSLLLPRPTLGLVHLSHGDSLLPHLGWGYTRQSPPGQRAKPRAGSHPLLPQGNAGRPRALPHLPPSPPLRACVLSCHAVLIVFLDIRLCRTAKGRHSSPSGTGPGLVSVGLAETSHWSQRPGNQTSFVA